VAKRKSTKRKTSHPTESPAARQTSATTAGIRLQKILANAGFGSRRECEKIIEEGRVDIDGETVVKLGTTADPDSQKIRIDGVRIKLPKRQYFAVNKPPGIISTNRDQSGRARVIDLIPTDQRIYTIGRLDKSSEGLILVTNDGDLANQLTHPKFGVEKTYHVHVAGSPSPDDLKLLQKGVYLAEGFAQVQRIKVRRRRKNFSELEMVLDEGRNREIRRLLARIGHKVLRLRRVAIGPMRLGDLPVGHHRRLTAEEVRKLKSTTANSAGAGTTRKSPRRKKFVGAKSTPSSNRSSNRRSSQGTSSPRTGTARTSTPRTSTPRTSTPRTSTPRTSTPRTSTPRTSTPRTSTPRTSTPRKKKISQRPKRQTSAHSKTSTKKKTAAAKSPGKSNKKRPHRKTTRRRR
jgi:23S rRNA pseudouridine2605 synthase